MPNSNLLYPCGANGYLCMVNLRNHAFFRFLVAGAINTVVTYGIFLVLAHYTHHTIAYTIAFVTGIGLSYAMAAVYVFRTAVTIHSVLRFPLVYAIQYLHGLCFLALLVDGLGFSKPLSMLGVIATSIPLTFVLTRKAMRSPAAGQMYPEPGTQRELKQDPTCASSTE
jgi:putative flippase GtrA